MKMNREFPAASYDEWKTRAPEDERWYWFDDENARGEYECAVCNDTGWIYHRFGCEPCSECSSACPDIEDAYERSPLPGGLSKI